MLCACGCGEVAPKAKGRNRQYRYVAGHHLRKSSVVAVAEDRGYKTPCMVWQLADNGDSGYGVRWDREQKRQRLAHVMAWEAVHGPVPEGLQLDHLCRVRLCVNAEHLEPVPGIENRRRGARVALKTHCAQGHDWIPENIGLSRSSGQRRCLVCERERARTRRAEKRECVGSAS